MPTELPYAADAEESLAFDELEVRIKTCRKLSSIYVTNTFSPQQVLKNQYEKEQAQKHVTTQTKFNYGALSRLFLA
jgi:fission 1 protein